MRRFLIAVVLLGVTAAYVRMHPPERLDTGRSVLRAVPANFGPWVRRESGLDEGIQEQLQADDVLLRRYENAGQSVWLCVVYHQNRRYGSHDPQLCYESQGFAVVDEGRARVDDGSAGGIPAHTFTVERRKEPRVVWYWWTTEGLSTGDVAAFRGRLALLGALENRSWGAFVRVEAEAPDGDVAAATARARDFAALAGRDLPGVFARARGTAVPRP
jgi:EpsI family protein